MRWAFVLPESKEVLRNSKSEQNITHNSGCLPLAQESTEKASKTKGGKLEQKEKKKVELDHNQKYKKSLSPCKYICGRKDKSPTQKNRKHCTKPNTSSLQHGPWVTWSQPWSAKKKEKASIFWWRNLQKLPPPWVTGQHPQWWVGPQNLTQQGEMRKSYARNTHNTPDQCHLPWSRASKLRKCWHAVPAKGTLRGQRDKSYVGSWMEFRAQRRQ